MSAGWVALRGEDGELFPLARNEVETSSGHWPPERGELVTALVDSEDSRLAGMKVTQFCGPDGVAFPMLVRDERTNDEGEDDGN